MVLLDEHAPVWARAHAVQTLNVDLHDETALLAAGQRIASQYGVSGVVTYMEHHVTAAARLAEQLGVPGNKPEAIAAARDKHRTRTLLAAAGVPSARSVLAPSEQDAIAYAAELGYPVVVKPRGMGGSAGVRRADTTRQVRDAYRTARSARVLGLENAGEQGVLVEQYLDGPEISVECVALGRGQVHVVAVTRKELGPEPAFEEVGHVVDSHEPLLANPRIQEVATAALDAVGIVTGVHHVEMRLLGGVQPHIIEINARLGGDLIPHLVRLATGVDLALIAAGLAVGEPIGPEDLQHTATGCAAVRFIYPAGTGQLSELTTPQVDASWLDTYTRTARPGQQVTAPPQATLLDRLVHIVVTGDTPQTCQDRIAQVERITTHTVLPTQATACVA
ncbi:ATP-grasp domain-containing protein [Streptomyces sp. NBC_01497]|uniref:ATP-grasp domain-containing protein n=1 Tax=Streptomyces sp. NBC_01497 TaxID=2903885 RepID=UPI002E31EC1F|nr:ATP-grasp domain-containing protein [Streptomyces sp. NBC_01497]